MAMAPKKKMRGGGMVKKMRGGGMVKKMQVGGAVTGTGKGAGAGAATLLSNLRKQAKEQGYTLVPNKKNKKNK